MYYLVISRLSERRCIALSERNDFRERGTYNCKNDFDVAPSANKIDEIVIYCSGSSGRLINADIWSDQQ